MKGYKMYGEIGYYLDPADEETPEYSDPGDFSNADSWNGDSDV